MNNVLKGTIKIDAPGVKETFAQVEQGVSNMQKKLGGVPSAAQQSADGLVTAFAKVSNIEIPPVKVDAEVGAINVPEVGIAPVKIPVTANTDAAKASLDNLGSSIKPLAIHLDTTEAQTKAKLLEGTIETLEGRLGAKKDLIRFVDPGEITKLAKLNREIQDLEKEIARLKNIGKQGFDDLGNKIDAYGNHLNTLSKRSAVATQSTINLGRVIQDAPYGFIGVANNLNPLLEGFQRLRAETGSAGGALKALGGSLMGAGGIGLAISVVSSLLVVFGDKLFGAGKSAEQQTSRIDQLKKSLNDLKAVTSSEILGSATGEFSKAVSVIETLRQNVDLAKKGFIDKKDVVNQYNKELGDTIGKVQTLDEVEKTIASKGNAYLQFTLLKAAAQEALKKASEAALQAAENEAKATDISSGAITKAAQKGLKDLPGVAGATALDKFNKATQKSVSEINKTVVQANQQKDKFINIFKDFQTRAAEIAKNNKFKFDVDIIPGTAEKQKFDKGDEDKKKKELEKILQEKKDILLEFIKDFETLKLPVPELSMPLEKFSVEGLTDELRDKLNDALLKQPLKLQVPTEIHAIDPKTIPIPLKIQYSIQQDIDAAEKLQKEIEDKVKALNQTITSSLQNSAINIGEALGNALSGGGFGNVLQTYAAQIGDLLQTMGKLLIQTAIKVELFKKALYTWAVANPGLAIAAGIGLIAFGKAIVNTTTPQLSGSHASGLKRVPKDGYIAELHKDEMVVPAKQSEKLRSIMGPDFSIPSLDKLAGSIGSANIKSSLPSFKGIQIPNIQVLQIKMPQLPSSPFPKYNNSAYMAMGKQNVNVQVEVKGNISGNDIALSHARTLKNQKITF